MNDQSGMIPPEPLPGTHPLPVVNVSGRPTHIDRPGDPRRPIRVGLIAAAAFFVLFLGWAAFVRLDSAVTAHGFVVVSGNRKAVQHRDGGIVEKLFVREGDEVRQGQTLLTLDEDELRGKERSTSSQVIALLAYKARLSAEIEGRSTITTPAGFAGMTGADHDDAVANMAVQRKEFEVRRLALATEKRVLRERMAELHQQAAGDGAQVKAAESQAGLVRDELVGIRDLQRQGYVAMSKVRDLERAEAEYDGQRGQYEGSVAKAMASVGETKVQMIGLDRNQAADAAQQYREADLKLAELQPELAALRSQVERTVVRAPASGRVVGLRVFTEGGVVAAGEMLMEIVPRDEGLVINANIEPEQIDGLHTGQRSEIRIPAFHNRGLPILNGTVSKISADRLTDEKSGKSYFEMEVTVPASQLKVMRDVRGSKTDLIAGLPVEVIVPQRKRSALDYFFEPIQQALWHSFREQ